jgi:hypothetical protein
VLNSQLDHTNACSIGYRCPTEGASAMPAPVIVVYDEPATRELAVNALNALCAAGLRRLGSTIR